MTYDLIDVEGPDSQRAWTKAWPSRSTSTKSSLPGADGSTATEDFGTSGSIINDCFVPQIVFSTTFGYRTDVAE